MQVLFENDDVIAFNKTEFIRVQADASGKESLEGRAVEFLAARSASDKPPAAGAQPADEPVFGIPVHRIDQPVTGVVLFAKNQEALTTLGRHLQNGKIEKTYWAVADAPPPAQEGKLEHYLVFNRKQNKSYASEKARPGAKKAVLHYRLAGKSERYFFLEIKLLTGRHHQIRAQLAAAGCHVKGDLKYGAARSNPGGGIHLHARRILFPDPRTGEPIEVLAPPPEDVLWAAFPGRESPGTDNPAAVL